MYNQYTSPLGYQTGGANMIDTYGVNHSGFSISDELAYQTARQKRENELIEQLNAQGITSNYPQYSTNFWGNPANNYGFGMTNIAANIANMKNTTTPIPATTSLPQMMIQPITSQAQRTNTSAWNNIKNVANSLVDGAEAFSVGYATGTTLGNFDEAMGGLATAFGADYKGSRDVVRQLQNNLNQHHPLAYGVGEFTGAMTTPMHLVKDSTFTNKALNAVTDTLNASVGYAENWNDLATNLLVNGFANSIGLGVDMAPIGRGLGATGKKIIKQGVNYLTDKAKNILYNSKR